MIRTKALTAAVLAMASVFAPAAHAEDTGVGFTCGFAATTDPTGVVTQNPNTRTGEVDCGPWVFANTAGGAVTSVTLTAIFCFNAPLLADCTAAAAVVRGSTTAGSVGFLIDTVQYTPAPGDSIYICSTWSWTSSKGGGSGAHDADELTPGTQCALATTVEA